MAKKTKMPNAASVGVAVAITSGALTEAPQPVEQPTEEAAPADAVEPEAPAWVDPEADEQRAVVESEIGPIEIQASVAGAVEQRESDAQRLPADAQPVDAETAAKLKAAEESMIEPDPGNIHVVISEEGQAAALWAGIEANEHGNVDAVYAQTIRARFEKQAKKTGRPFTVLMQIAEFYAPHFAALSTEGAAAWGRLPYPPDAAFVPQEIEVV